MILTIESNQLYFIIELTSLILNQIILYLLVNMIDSIHWYPERAPCLNKLITSFVFS